jgi:integrase
MYADKRDGVLTGSWVGEWRAGKKKRRFKTKVAAEDYERFTKLFGREPPTIEDGGGAADGELTYAEVVARAKAAGGPKGKWSAGKDHSLLQRIDYGVGIIGSLGITKVDRAALTKVRDSLDNRPSSPGKSGVRGADATRNGKLSNATKNRYVNAAHTVLTFAHYEGLIDHVPVAPLLDEKGDRRYRDILTFGQDEVVLRLMSEAGDKLEATCVDIFLQTGLRQGELQKLQPEQVTIEQVEDDQGTPVPVGVLHLRRGQTKNQTARLVTFSADLATQLRLMLVNGTLPKASDVLRTFKDACERAGYTGNLVIHGLRHTRNTRLRKAGISQKIRKELLGHISDEANDIYDHVDLTDLLEVEKKVQEYAGRRHPGAREAAPQVVDFVRRGAG